MANADTNDPRHFTLSLGDQVLLFYLAPQYRRAVQWGMGGCVSLPVFACFMLWFRQRPIQLEQILVNVLTMVAGPLWLCQYLLPRVRVDQFGVSQKRLWWWEQWPWEAFVDGRVEFGSPAKITTYQLAGKPLSQRSFSLLSDDDAETINSLIRAVWNPPPAEPIPKTVKVEFHWPDRRSVEMTSEQITITTKGRMAHYRWDEIAAVEIWRNEYGRHDFRELCLHFTDEQVPFRHAKFYGKQRESLAGFICHHVDPARLRDFALLGSPRTLEELDARLAREELELNELRKLRWVLGFFLVCSAVLALWEGWPSGAVLTDLYAPQFYAGYWAYCDKVSAVMKRQQELEGHRSQLTAERF